MKFTGSPHEKDITQKPKQLPIISSGKDPRYIICRENFKVEFGHIN
jgi:hypothetical protein